MAGLVCDIVTPAARLYSDDAYMVVVPGVEGEMGFLQGHAPLVSVLADGVARALHRTGIAVLSKLTGLLLAAIAAQVIFTGIRAFLG